MIDYETLDKFTEEIKNAMSYRIPELPEILGERRDGKFVALSWACKVCDTEYGLGEQHDYCPHCGQRIQWGEETE